MNKIYRVASASLVGVLLLLAMGSCSKESQLTPEAQPEAGAGQLAFSLDNDALRSVPAEDFEKAVDPNSVWCVFLTSAGSGAQTVQTAKPAYKTPAGNYSVNAGFVGAAQMFVIGNVESDLQSKLNNLTSGTTLEQVQKWIVKNSLGNGSANPAKFVMTSDLVNVTLPAVGAAPTNLSTPIVLKRLAARFDVINEVPGLTLTTVTVANRILSSTLFNVSQTGTEVAATTDYTVDGGKQLLHKIYSYQNTNKGGAANATSFTLKGTYGGKAIKDIKVDLKNVADSQPLDVQRNYCYRIILKPTGDNDKPINPNPGPDPGHPQDPKTAWKVTIKVVDWNEAATDLANYTDEELAALGKTIDLSQTINPSGVNVLNAVAEYNIDITGTKFTRSHTNEAGYSGYFTFKEAKALTMPAGYHLPTYNEFVAILGNEPSSDATISFYKNKSEKDVSLTVQIPGQTRWMTCLQDYKQVSADHAIYMIRYKDNDTYRSAWCYSYVDGPIAGQKVLKIEAVPVKADLTIEKLNKEYFANPKVSKYVKTIYLPTTGYGYNRDGSGSGSNRGSSGYYWFGAEEYSDTQHYMSFNSTYAFVSFNANQDRYALRPFRGI